MNLQMWRFTCVVGLVSWVAFWLKITVRHLQQRQYFPFVMSLLLPGIFIYIYAWSWFSSFPEVLLSP